MKFAYLVVFALLAGCADGVEMRGDNSLDIRGGAQMNEMEGENETVIEHPVMVRANDQTHLITIIGSESGLLWSNATISFSEDSDLSCIQDMPTQGYIRPGQVIHITADIDVYCSVTVFYNEVEAGTWNFSFEEPQ